MFDTLSGKLDAVFKKLRGRGVLKDDDVREAMREVRLALHEADVNFKVVKEFINKVQERAVGSEILASLTPGQQVIKVVHEELVGLLGGVQSKLHLSPNPPTVIMMVGLQGSGKTTRPLPGAWAGRGRAAEKCRRCHVPGQVPGKKPLLHLCPLIRQGESRMPKGRNDSP